MQLPLWARLAVGVGFAAILAYMATPVAIVAARRLSFYDRPVDHKRHAAPTPYLGGAAMMLAFAVALLLAAGRSSHTLELLLGVVVLWALGTLDDRKNLSPLVRVAVEFSVAVLLSLLGNGWQLGIGQPLDALVNGMWVVGVINAFNLFDNMDGAASTMGLVVMGGACALGWLNGNAWAVAGSAALCGACIGFLPHNLARPAKIFLGDGGSMPLGFAVAMLVPSAARGDAPAVLSLLTGLLLIALPALDTTLVVISRRRRGVSILTGGQDHLTHRTKIMARTARRVAIVLGSAQAVVSAAVIIATRTSNATLVYMVLALVICAALAIICLEQMIDTPPGPPRPELTTAATAPIGGAPGGWFSAVGEREAAVLTLVTLGLGCGLSALFSSFYTEGVWIPIGFCLVLAAAFAGVARLPRLTGPQILSIGGLAALGLLALLSSGWAQAAESATTTGNRWLAYSALLLLAALVLRRRHLPHVLLGAGALGILTVAGDVVVRMLGSHAASLFLGGRLNGPLGYINGEGCVFAMGCWLMLALAERREAPLAGVGAAGTVLLGGLTLLSQSRGAALALLVSLLAGLALLPGRPRRIFALSVIGLGIAAVTGALLKVYSSSHDLVVPGAVAHHAAVSLLIGAALAGAAWTAIVAVSHRLALAVGQPERLRNVSAAFAVVVVLVPCVALAANAGSIERSVRTQWHAFVHLSDASTSPGAAQTRLFSGAGNRYDYWRIAWAVFRAHPAIGVGAGNYASFYYRQRHTQEAIENPHSLELQTLAELGLVGCAALLVFLGGVLWGAARLRNRARSSPMARTVLVAGVGAFVVWLVDTSGDWMHLLPGVTGVALLSAAALTARGVEPEGVPGDEPGHGARSRHRLARGGRLAGAAVLALTLTFAGASLLRQGVAQHYLARASAELSRNPSGAIADAASSLRLDGANLDAYYVEAAGEARFNHASASRALLQAAAREDPQAFVTWVLLGDLQVRLKHFSAARVLYGRAHALDPNDPAVTALARDPAAAAVSSLAG